MLHSFISWTIQLKGIERQKEDEEVEERCEGIVEYLKRTNGIFVKNGVNGKFISCN